MTTLAKPASPENLTIGTRYRYQTRDGGIHRGIFMGLTTGSDRKLALAFKRLGANWFVRWTAVKSIAEEGA